MSCLKPAAGTTIGNNWLLLKWLIFVSNIRTFSKQPGYYNFDREIYTIKPIVTSNVLCKGVFIFVEVKLVQILIFLTSLITSIQ